VLHRADGTLACHHCGHRERVPPRCPACGSVSIARHGTGTERLEAELDGPVFRLDADVGADAARVLARFEAAAEGVLVGTQMVAKGHDFPTSSSGSSSTPTRRCASPTSAPRSARSRSSPSSRAAPGAAVPAGRVLVQTLVPDAPSIALAARHDADAFVEAELARRRALRYPPFSTLVRIVCASQAPGAAHGAAAAVRARLGDDALGPAPLFRLRGRERSQVVVKAADRAVAVGRIGAAVQAVASERAHRAVAFSVDVDPQ
jgi:primosomal protein N' (replication factor Y)